MAMKENKSPGVDGIPPKLLMETVEHISVPFARVFNLSLKERVVPFEWAEANIIPRGQNKRSCSLKLRNKYDILQDYDKTDEKEVEKQWQDFEAAYK